MNPRELPVSFFDVHVRAKFRHIQADPPPPNAMAILALCRPVQLPTYSRGAIRIELPDWEIDRHGRHQLLMNRADSNKTDIAMVNYRNGHRRTAGKTPEDGYEFSSHLIIAPPGRGHHNPLLLMTGGSSLSRVEVQRLLNNRLRVVSRDPQHQHLFQVQDPSGVRRKTVRVHMSIELLPHQSVLLNEVLRRGRLNEVDLIEHVADGLDRHFQTKIRRVTIGVVPGERHPILADLMRAVRRSGINPDSLLLRFRDLDTDKPTQRTLAINELENAMTKKELISFNTDISSRYARLQPEIIDKLIELL